LLKIGLRVRVYVGLGFRVRVRVECCTVINKNLQAGRVRGSALKGRIRSLGSSMLAGNLWTGSGQLYMGCVDGVPIIGFVLGFVANCW